MIVIINEQHTLLEAQKELLLATGKYQFFLIPSTGITKMQMLAAAEQLQNEEVVFVSPIPLLLASVVATNQKAVYLFHNDQREKNEVNDKIMTVIAKTGWELIKVK